MNLLGEFALLIAFVGSGYAGFACVAGRKRNDPALGRAGDWAAAAALVGLSVAVAVLAWALLARDFRFAYVAEYSSRRLPWHYSLSALWVGQAGSLLVWAWLLGLLALAYRFWPRRESRELVPYAFGILMAYLCFLVAIMLFAADPMKASVAGSDEGAGLSPLLQHPAMLIHPPLVLLGYAAWAVPFALAAAAVAGGRLDAAWARQARPWALFAWATLGAGILLGGLWAYEELGWGGYWGWDPVENGSLIPWLTGTALIHTLLAWQYRGAWKKTALALAIATFGLCNFATFLTRSGIFSSLHAFSHSPIGWMFLVLMTLLAAAGGALVILRRKPLRPDRPVAGVWSREAAVLILCVALLLLAAVTCAGTLSLPLSNLLFGKKAMVGPAFYNHVLIPTGLLSLAATAIAPLLRWGKPPAAGHRKALLVAAALGAAAAATALVLGVRHGIGLAVAGLAAVAVAALVGNLRLDAAQRAGESLPRAVLNTLRSKRRSYAGFLIHLGFVCLAVGITGSSLGTRRHEVVMREGDTIQWAGRRVHLVRLIQRQEPGKLIAEARLEVARGNRPPVTLLPAQHLHLLQNSWTTEVAVHSTWGGDFYTIAQLGEGGGRARLTLVLNPLMRWIWLGGWIIAAGTLIGLWPARRRAARPPSPIPAPKFATRAKKRQHVTSQPGN